MTTPTPLTAAGKRLAEFVSVMSAEDFDWHDFGADILAIEQETRDAARAAEGPTDEDVKRELHRVLCQNAKHRSRFTGECHAAPNIARGLRAALASQPVASEGRAGDGGMNDWNQPDAAKHRHAYPKSEVQAFQWGIQMGVCRRCAAASPTSEDSR